jgi:hypothetical protein
MWYSFDYGPVHFVALNTETDFPGAPEEHFGDCTSCRFPAGSFGQSGEYLTWLEADLKAAHANRDEVPWIVTFGHRPFVVDDGMACFEPVLCQSTQDLIDKYADVYIAGHIHYYSRLIPLPGQKRKAAHLVSGGAGNDEWLERSFSSAAGGRSEKYDWLAYGMEQSVSRLNVVNRSRIELEGIRAVDGQVFDKVVIEKSKDGKNSYSVDPKRNLLIE